MAKRGSGSNDGQVWVQLATRIPKTLHRELKLHCVSSEDDVSIMRFVVGALNEKLDRDSEDRKKKRKRAAAGSSSKPSK